MYFKSVFATEEVTETRKSLIMVSKHKLHLDEYFSQYLSGVQLQSYTTRPQGENTTHKFKN